MFGIFSVSKYMFWLVGYISSNLTSSEMIVLWLGEKLIIVTIILTVYWFFYIGIKALNKVKKNQNSEKTKNK